MCKLLDHDLLQSENNLHVYLFLGLLFVTVASAGNVVNVVFYNGEDEFLECNMSDASIAWTFYANLDPTVEREISYSSRLVDKSGKYNITSEGRILIVYNVTDGDSGRYLCDGPIPKRQRFNVTVEEPLSNAVSIIYVQNCLVIALCSVYAIGGLSML